MTMSPSTRGRIGALTLHSRYDSREITEPARRGFFAKFEREVDPERVLSPDERLRRATLAQRAYMLRLAAKSAEARRREPRER